MEQSRDALIKMGIVHFMAFPQLGGGEGPWVETVEQIARDTFFSAIEITRILDHSVRREVRDICRLAQLAVGFGAHPVILGEKRDLNALEPARRREAVERMKELLDEAAFMEAESFVVLSGRDPGPEKREQAVEALVESLVELCRYSGQVGGPPVVIEAFDQAVDKCCLLGPAPLAARVAREVRRRQDNFGLLVDLSHIPLLDESPWEALEPVKEWLAAAHLGNAVMSRELPAYGDNHPPFGAPGGVNHVPQVMEFLQVLRRIGFLDSERRPMVSFEVKPMQGQDPLLVIANAKRVMKRAWALA